MLASYNEDFFLTDKMENHRPQDFIKSNFKINSYSIRRNSKPVYCSQSKNIISLIPKPNNKIYSRNKIPTNHITNGKTFSQTFYSFQNTPKNNINNEIDLIKLKMNFQLLNHKLNNIKQYANDINTNNSYSNYLYKNKSNISNNYINTFYSYNQNNNLLTKKNLKKTFPSLQLKLNNTNFTNNFFDYNNYNTNESNNNLYCLSETLTKESNNNKKTQTQSICLSAKKENIKNISEIKSKSVSLDSKNINKNMEISNIANFELNTESYKNEEKKNALVNFSINNENNFMIEKKNVQKFKIDNKNQEKEKKIKKISFDENDIIIRFDNNKDVKRLFIQDSNGKKIKKKYVDMSKYFKKLKSNKKIKGILSKKEGKNNNILKTKENERKEALDKLTDLINEIEEDEIMNKGIKVENLKNIDIESKKIRKK